MPLPPPHQSTNEDAKKYQSDNIVSSDHDPSKKREEKNQAKIFSSSPQGTVKKRSAFEDLTNASLSQLVQPKKEEFVKDVSKNTTKKTHTFGFAKNNEKKIKKYRVELLPAESSTTSVSNMDISTKSKTESSVKAFLFKKALVSKEETATNPMSKTLKRCTHYEKKLLTLLEEIDNDEHIVESMTLGKKYKPEETAISEDAVLGNQKVYVHQREQFFQEEMSTWKKPLALKKPSTEKESQFQMASVFKKCYMDEATATNLSLSLPPQQHTIQETVSTHLKNPLALQTVSSGKESLTKEPLSIEKENLPLQKNKCTTQAIPCWSIDNDRKLFCTESVLLKKEPTSEKEFLRESSSLKDKHTTAQEVSLSKSASQKTSSEELNKKPMTLKEGSTNGKFFLPELFSPYSSTCEDKPIFQKETIDFQEKTFTKNNSSQNQFPSLESEENFISTLFGKKYSSPKAGTRQERMIAHKQLLMLKKVLYENTSSSDDESLIKQPLASQMPPRIEEKVTEKALDIQESCTEEMAVLKEHTIDTGAQFNYVDLQEIPSIVKNAISKGPLALKEKLRTDIMVMLKDVLAWLENTRNESEVILEDSKPNTKTEAILKEPLVLQENPCIEKEASPKESLDFHDKPIRKDNILNPLAFQEKCNIEAPFKNILAVNEKHTTVKRPSCKYPLTMEEDYSTQDGNTILKAFSLSSVESSSHVVSSALESRADKSGIINMPTTTKSSLDESGSQNPYSYPSRTQTKNPEDVDTLENIDPVFNSVYAKEIFSYMKEREEKFILQNYMDRQIEINADMRAILVDWMVEIQVSFGVSHESLYLAVKLVDHCLMKVTCRKRSLQLLGCTALFIATKFEETYPPCLNEFLYICQNAYQKSDICAMEVSILRILDFDINIPTAYNFLRPYASCLHASMPTLTLSRYICEMSLQRHYYIQEKPSKLAAACFLLALYMKNLIHWAPSLEKCSGYQFAELHPLVWSLNMMLISHPYDYLKNVYNKYSDEIFFAVNKIPPLDKSTMEKILS